MNGGPVVGAPAPVVTVSDQHGQLISPTGFAAEHGTAVLLVFFPFAFSGTCTGELCAIRDDLGSFANDQVQVMGVSCDPVHSLRAWGESQGYEFPLLSDFWPHGDAARAYGAFLPEKGFATRASFLIDTAGVLRWAVVQGPGEPRDLQQYRDALATL